MPTHRARSRELQRVRYFESPDIPSRVTSSLKVTKVDPAIARELIARSPRAQQDYINRHPFRRVVVERGTLDLLHLYY
jgi:hypothetical protein